MNNYEEKIQGYDSDILIQKRIIGREFACGCFIKEGDIEVLPVVEVKTPRGLLGFDEKFGSGGYSRGFLSQEDPFYHKISRVSLLLTEKLRYETHCRFDFMADAVGNLFLLEVNTTPGMLKTSLFVEMLRVKGYGVEDLIIASQKNGNYILDSRGAFGYIGIKL